MGLGIRVPKALPGGAIEDRGGWTWSFPCDLITGLGTWPALDGGAIAQLALSGLVDIQQKTPGLGARGAGSARVDRAVLGGAGGRWISGAQYPSPAANSLLIRLILRETRQTGTATYLELSQAAQRITIRRNVLNLELIANLGTYTETIYAAPLLNAFMLLDVILDSAAQTFRAYVNGIDFTPSFTGAGGAITAFGGAATLALLNNVAAGDAAVNAELVFAGVRTTSTLTLAEHREDAEKLFAIEDGFAIDGLGGYTWAWSPNRVDTTTQPAPTLPGEPSFGDVAARLTVSEDVIFDVATRPTRPEGLSATRIDTAFRLATSSDRVFKSAPSGFEVVDGDLHGRVVFKIESTGVMPQRLLFLEDATDSSLLFGIEVDPTSGDLNIFAPSSYALTLAAAVVRDEWHLLDVSIDRDNGGGVAQFVVLLDGVQIAAAAHSGLVADIPENAAVTLFDRRTFLGGADATAVVFAALTRGRVLDLARHRVDALSLGVMS